MIIDVRPTPALRRHRARIAGVAAAVVMVVASLCSVAALAHDSRPVPDPAPTSGPAGR
ncbi:hypothetical protein [Nocardioides sp.]|uniref:hypothetical protein n=1 Tax=Nocardioides sp. TaxID=35761 RepID=UPI00378321B1